MIEPIKGDLANIWQNASELIEEGEFEELGLLSNHTIHNSSIYHDELSVSAAVIVYSLYKIGSRLNSAHVIGLITKLMQALGTDDETAYRKTQSSLFKYIREADSHFNLYIDDVLDQAKIKKGWKLYEHGLSIGASAGLLGISKWELMNYVGNTRVADTIRTDVRSRIKFTRGLFR